MSYHGFDLQVYVYRRANMLDESLEYELYMGTHHLRRMFIDEKVDESTTELFFSFPERWLNIIQERSLYIRIQKFFPNVKKVVIKTQSVFIIQNTKSDCVQIVVTDEEQGQSLYQECASGPTYYPMSMNIIKSNQLNVL